MTRDFWNNYSEESILPTNDLMFETIFWNKDYPDVLISFINAILKRDDPIKSIELVNTEMDNKFIGEHGIRLDLVATTSSNEILNVEMQKKNNDALREQIDSTSVETNIYKRSLFYWAKIYSSQLKQSQYYKDLHPVIAINILDFNLFKDTRCSRNFILKDEKTNEEYSSRMLDIYFVELNKRKYMDQNDELWAWTEFLKAPNSCHLDSIQNEVESIANAKYIFNKTSANSVEREKIRLLEKTQMDNLSAIHYAKEEGLAEGLEKGEHKKALETAKNLLAIGLSIEQIAKATSLDIEEVKSLNQ